MKKLAFVIFLAIPLLSPGQISLENTYNYSGTYTNLKVSGDKFFIMDVVNSQCRIYNTDHSLWKTINLSVPSNNYVYDIKFVSENLFTTDNTLCLAYVYYYYDEVNQFYTYNAKIIRENGSLLLTIPGCQHLNLYRTKDGATKLITYSYDYSLLFYTITTRIYSLPGTITSIAEGETGLPVLSNLPAFPNPASTEVSIPYSLPAGSAPARLSLINEAGQVVKETIILPENNKCTLNIQGMKSGVYLYRIDAASGSHTGKIVVN
ncbi:MAG: T9SS type A sorting domain-containing protein [Lentimicrobium sp.]|nr:T9SS type A sorting domain-containing protein [Lentimicrobium sp.]